MLLLGPCGCTTLSWYGQAVRGQLALIIEREPSENWLAAPGLDADRRAKLLLVGEALEFAHARLGLPDNGSYRHLYEPDGDALLWNVVAVPEFALEPRRWCYPLVGCLSYRGWFDRAAAEREAVRLRRQGDDVRIAPVFAYSTLGHARDPLVAPMLDWPAPELVGRIFHELAHQRLFVPGDTAFSEAYAGAVERAGVAAFLEARGAQATIAAWQRRLALREARTQRLLAARHELLRIYARGGPPTALRRAKFGVLERLALELETQGLGGAPEGGFNNADLALIATYESGIGAFLDLLAEYDGDFGAFHAAVERLAAADPELRAKFLDP